MKNRYSKIHSILYTKEKQLVEQTIKLGNKQIFGGIDVKGPAEVSFRPFTTIDVILSNAPVV
jgi:hypothetical protein